MLEGDKRGWFEIEGVQSGERKLVDQIAGLEQVVRDCEGKTVLDIGCAEGLISFHFLVHKASSVSGFDCNQERAQWAKKINMDHNFYQMNADDFPSYHQQSTTGIATEPYTYDIILLLSILQKLRNPKGVLEYCAKICTKWIAVRLPQPTIRDKRSGFFAVNVPQVLMNSGFEMVNQTRTDYGAWVGVFKRCS